MRTDKPSDEILNAFVDGEFCPEERLATLRQISSDDRLSREICDLCQIKEMVNLAYERVPAPPQRRGRVRHARGGWLGPVAAAVVMMLSVAGITGVGLGLQEPTRVTGADLSQPLHGTVRETSRILLHLTTTDPERITNMLDEVELLMGAAKAQGVALQIQVVAHGEGLALLREDISPFPQRVAQLSERFSRQGLSFTACLNTIERLRREENIHVRLLPEAHVINSGVAEVVRRQSQGWAYIQV
jgi:intracellular sulfur oxidation DsrE/DsrF family protein